MASITTILQDIAAGTISPEEGQKLIADLKPRSDKAITLKVGQKGGISIYGLRRMPISLYESELVSILDHFIDDWKFKPEIEKWLSDNRRALSSKPQAAST